MNFEGLKARVERSERLVEGRLEQTRSRSAALRTSWREAWTPGRIVLVGLASGFLVGRTEAAAAVKKIGKLGGTHWIQLITSISGVVASLQSAMATDQAKQAADSADAAAASAGDVVAASTTGAAPDSAAGAAAAAAAVAAAAEVEAEAVPPSDRRRRPDPSWDAPPRAAEAATEVSER